MTGAAQQNTPPSEPLAAPSPSQLSLSPTLSVMPPTRGSEDARVAALVAAKRWSELLTYSEGAVAANTRDARAQYWRGIANFQLRKPIAAVQSLRAAQLLGLDNAAMHEALGLAYYDLNQFILFEEQMKLASSRDARDSAPAYYLGLYRLSIQSDVKGALTYFRDAVRLNPSDPKSRYQLGYCLELAGDAAGARTAFLESIRLVEEKHQMFGWPYQGMARIEMNTAPAEAMTYAKKAVELEPNEPTHHFILAKIYEQDGKYRAGIEEASIAAEQQPNDAAARYLLFRMYKRSGDSEAADAQLKRFQAIQAAYGSE
jgi:tetratricopeptide (TPR) repeat protein